MAANKRADRLSRDTIVAAALRLLDEVGVDGLTVRRIAADLGVQNPALYWHFRDKQELLDGMADAIVRSAGMGPPRKGETWQRWLSRRARAYRAALLAHRDGARVVSNASRLGPETLVIFDRELAALTARGFSPTLALRTITAISLYTNGFVLREQHDANATSTASDVLPTASPVPVLLAAITGSGPTPREDSFEHGLRALIDGTTIALNRIRGRHR